MDMYGDKEPELTNQQKAAILFITLGPEYSAMLFKHMNDEEIEKLTLEIANQKQISPEQKRAVISEFYQMAMAKSYLSSGGLEYAQSVLEKALGSEKASAIISRLTTSLQVRPFDFLHKTDPSQLLNFIQNEHPQTIALIMAYLDPDQAATILRKCIQNLRPEVEKMSILQPFSFVLIDEDHETLQDLVIIDSEETVVFDHQLLEGFEEDLDQFFDELMKEE